MAEIFIVHPQNDIKMKNAVKKKLVTNWKANYVVQFRHNGDWLF